MRLTKKWMNGLKGHLREQVERCEYDIAASGLLSGLFGQRDDRTQMLGARKAWARTLALLLPLERHLESANEKWWSGPEESEWTRKEEAQAQIKNPKRRLQIHKARR